MMPQKQFFFILTFLISHSCVSQYLPYVRKEKYEIITDSLGNISTKINFETTRYNKFWEKNEIKVLGTPFWGVSAWHDGTFLLDNQPVKSKICYDLAANRIYVLPFESKDSVEIFPNEFTIDKYKFICKKYKILGMNQTEIYLVLYEGQSKFLGKISKKIIQVPPNSNDAFATKYNWIFKTSLDYYYLKNGKKLRYLGINAHNVVEKMKDKKGEIQRFIKENQLKFVENNPIDNQNITNITKIFAYYDQLKSE